MPDIIRPRLPHEPKHLRNGDPIIIFQARLGAIVNFPILEDQGQGYVEKMFEKYVRPPGTRVIAVRDNKIYLQKEWRWEGNDWQWRVPGGKLVDSFEEYKKYLDQPIPEAVILEAAKKELHEEAHLEAQKISFFKKMICGTFVEWDLLYVVAEDIKEFTIVEAIAEGEDIRNSGWFSFEEVREMCEDGSIDEGRTVVVLLQFMRNYHLY